ncbi:polysaccharide biosynthesis/export family protein [Methylovirgula sp. 4M-Z18]|uniref:polysaccharide biosynthesis/export family protein n=1 Tax=Methylovirgula sp. 4M-Z18 TaxID=2293567 RepID=UPI001314306C|nr:polysaccharide biosynthesis/export family protein [Methylovirgula sp. 4M-Z18]
MTGLACVFFAAACLAGCSTLPKAGPNAKTIIERGDSSTYEHGELPPYTLIDISGDVVAALARHRPSGFRGSFGMSGPAPGGLLGIGDTVQVSVYESAPGGLFSTGDVGTGLGTKNVQLPQQQIARDGTITVPFAGQIQAAGRAPADVSSAIVAALSRKAIEPQVLVSLIKNSSNTVSVSGEVPLSGEFPLSLKGDRVGDVIAQAGVPKVPARGVFVRLTRGRRSATMRLSDLLEQPSQDIFVRPGDQIFLYTNPESFTVLGATGKNADVEFEGNRLTLAQAVGKAGGLDDQRSDAAGVFLFRYEDACAYADIENHHGCGASGAPVPVVYRLDLKDPNNLLVAQRFYLRDKDVLYIADAQSMDVFKFAQLLGTGLGVVGAGATISGR